MKQTWVLINKQKGSTSNVTTNDVHLLVPAVAISSTESNNKFTQIQINNFSTLLLNEGYQIYNLDTHLYQYWNGNVWIEILQQEFDYNAGTLLVTKNNQSVLFTGTPVINQTTE